MGTGGGSGDGGSVSGNTTTSTAVGGMGGSMSATAATGTGGGGTAGDTTSGGTGGSGATGGVGGSGTTGESGASAGGMSGTGGGAGTGASGGVGASGGTGGSGGTSCTPTEEICDGQDNDCNDRVDEEDVCPDGCVGASFASHSYLFCDRPRAGGGNSEPARSWQQAMQYCSNRDLNLTLIESKEENAFIYETLVHLELRGDVWMGATDQDDEELWTWALGDDSDDWIPFYDQDEEEPIDGAFNDWRDGEPNDDGGEDCGIFEDLGGDEWAWDDRSCQTQFDLFVCESMN